MSHFYNESGDLVQPGPGAYPSPSTILERVQGTPGAGLAARIGQEAADVHMELAAERGTRIHKACELWLIYHVTQGIGEAREQAGNEALLHDGDWAYLDGFINWWETFNPELLATEMFLINHTLKYAGRCDLIVRIAGELWLIDIKTGMTMAKHGLQVKFYQEAWRDMVKAYPDVIEPMRMGGLYLDAKRACGYRYFKNPLGLLEYRESLASIKAHLGVHKWWAKKEPAKQPGGATWEL